MTSSLPSRETLLDFVTWRNQAIEEAWDMADLDDDTSPSLANPFQITDLQHWIDLCA